MIDLFLRGIGRMCESSPALARALLALRFKGRCRIVAAMRRSPLVPEREVEFDGLCFDLDVADDIQRAIYYGCYEPRDLALIAPMVREGGTCLDVGANIGFYTLYFARRVGPDGRVYAFEPDPRNAARLRRNVALNRFEDRVRVREEAISDRAGKGSLHRSDAEHSGLGSLAPHADETAAVEVPVTTVDEFLAREGIEHVDLLKADVEGYEIQFLHGAARSLERRLIRRLFIEFNGVRLADRGLGLLPFLEPLERAGYRPGPAHVDLVDRVKRGLIAADTVWPSLLFEAP